MDELTWLRVQASLPQQLGELSTLAFGIHLRLMLTSAMRGPLPADRVALARLAAVTPEELEREWPGLKAHWRERSGQITCAFVEAERLNLGKQREGARKGGLRSAEVRRRNPSYAEAATQGATQGATQASSLGSTIESKSKKEEKELERCTRLVASYNGDGEVKYVAGEDVPGTDELPDDVPF